MAMHDRITSDPQIMGGKPVIRGTRVPVKTILRKLGAGMTPEAMIAEHPLLTLDDIRAAQAFAADQAFTKETGRRQTSTSFISVVTAMIAVTGVLLGAGAQYFFSQRTDVDNQYRLLRTNAYVDFIKSTAGIAIAQKMNDPAKQLEFTIQLTDAKSRIGLYGSKAVVSATADFFRKYAALKSPEALSSFSSIVTTMRAETRGGDEKIPNADVGQLLFGIDLP
jgi:uncharacterized protein (DUF433 family)